MQQHLLFDLETLGIKERETVIATVACVPFYLEELNTFEELKSRAFFAKVDCSQQIKNGSCIDPSTMQWWSEQPEDVRKMTIIPHESDLSVEEAFANMADFITNQTKYSFKESFIWSRGTAFDFPKIEYRYDAIRRQVKTPINFWKVRDVRTYIDTLTGGNSGIYTNDFLNEVKVKMRKHYSLDDAVFDALTMQQLYNELFNS